MFNFIQIYLNILMIYIILFKFLLKLLNINYIPYIALVNSDQIYQS
jgi:hypothetical protein